ncbi:hypothetical protein LA080_009283 [Diaporthe eres]|nr:hypothetical protein LA080_009283 [Diaporthe eres]
MSRLLRLGLHDSFLKKRHLCLLFKNPRGLEAKTWVENTDVALKALHLRFQKKQTRDDVKKRDDRPGEAPVDPDRPPSLIVGDQIERYNNIGVIKSFLGPFDLATGMEVALREDPVTTIYQKALPFPGGKRMYPAYLICPSTAQRANMEPLVMAFDISGMIGPPPQTHFVPPYDRPSPNRIKQIEICEKPVQPAMCDDLPTSLCEQGMSENHDLVLKAHSSLRFLVNEKAVFASPKLAKVVLLAEVNKFENMPVFKVRGGHPDDQFKLVLAFIDVVESDAEISFYVTRNTDESTYLDCLVNCRDLFHEFGIEKLGVLTAAVNEALTDAFDSMRCEAEHPGVHIVHKRNGVLRRSPTLEMGPGEVIMREIVAGAGAGAIWAAKGPWEIGRAKMSEAVCFCTLYLRNFPGFVELMNDNNDFGAALAQLYIWLFVQMCKAYRTMRDDHTSSICRKWNLPGDREQRLRFIDQLPVHAFLPETFPYGDVPYLHLPSKERLAFLGIFMTDDSYHRHTMRLQGMANLRGKLSNGNWDAFMTVAAVLSSRNATNADQPMTNEQMSAQVIEFAADADAEAKSIQSKIRDQFERMKKYKVLKLHKYRMHTQTILAHFDRKAFKYFQVLEDNAFNLVEEAGGHGEDFQKSIMFDHENMHVEVDLSPAEEQLLAAANYTP